ncbi:Leucine-rich repeat transmembrane protein kinase [Prunus dulcis]|uniref:non-specific serine/threonine protein kinase n=1 Tax=Prunus dulcis TaxID=3755 RepID=A0A4Y1RBM1_PRUDU|nr:Leucine-rich repeat transmembrane protein kinase [Prunus dulcis]
MHKVGKLRTVALYIIDDMTVSFHGGGIQFDAFKKQSKSKNQRKFPSYRRPPLFSYLFDAKIVVLLETSKTSKMGFVISTSKIVFALVLGFLALNCFTGFESNAQLLPLEEVLGTALHLDIERVLIKKQMVLRHYIMNICSKSVLMPLTNKTSNVRTLETISTKLHNTLWNISRSSCQGGGSGFYRYFTDNILSNVTCNCSFANNTCHVTNIELKGLNLTGVIPDEFGNLTHLEEIDLTRNYINGSIPASLSRAPLRILSLLGNRLSGSIPAAIGDFTMLRELVLEDNQFDGPLPQSLGKLTDLERLLLSANNFTGTIPESLGNLKKLDDFRIDGSRLSGKIPSFIGNWTNLERLHIHGRPHSFHHLFVEKLNSIVRARSSILRISDLNGSSMPFPNLTDTKNLETVTLRNCSISGLIPDYIGDLTKLTTLDLSFNKLTGEIPENIQGVDSLDYMFLTSNLLTGQVPSWIINNKNNLDLSYNNFTGSPSVSCPQLTVNLVSSYSSPQQSWCLEKDLPCPSKPRYFAFMNMQQLLSGHHSLFINCGGERMEFEGNEYEQDLTRVGISHFVSSSDKWGYSSTGVYMGKSRADYIAGNTLSLNMNGPEFYQTARLAPLSLKYYGFCMIKGSYKVKLHFSEIMYSDSETFSSLGKRIFDVSIQGNLVLKDFNIMEEAGGVGKGIVREYDVLVNGSTLEIHLYWAGKGTTAIPDRGVYGPLISAITVTPNFKVDTGGLSAGAISGIVVASCVSLVLVLVVLRLSGFLGGKDEDKELRRGLELQTGYFTLRQIKAATGNFDPSNKIGEGGFGPVYKGVLADGAVIAVKQLSSKSKQGNREFVNEIGMISALQHPNLVKLFGCCIEGNQLLLIYEYMENNSLARALFGKYLQHLHQNVLNLEKVLYLISPLSLPQTFVGRDEQRLNLDWKTRKKICLGIARGLAYLHEESRLKIVHRDIKATNVLLDKDLNAKISDFGLAKLDEEENTHISTRIAGTIGYMAPEYAMRGYLTDKADVYSFGIVALEIVSGKSNTNYRPKEEFVYLLDGAYVLQEQGNMLELVDPSLGSNYSKEEAMTMLNLALLCCNPSPTLRPPMSSVVSMLEGKSPVQAPTIKRGSAEQDAKFKAFERLSQDSQTHVSTFSQDSHVRGASMEGPWVDSSVSLASKDETMEHSSSTKLLKDMYDS